jgi:hypothetical protein
VLIKQKKEIIIIKKKMERLHGIMRTLRGLESLWGEKGDGRL